MCRRCAATATPPPGNLTGTDDRPSIWHGRWAAAISADRYGVDQREIFDMIEGGLFVWDPGEQLWKHRDDGSGGQQ